MTEELPYSFSRRKRQSFRRGDTVIITIPFVGKFNSGFYHSYIVITEVNEADVAALIGAGIMGGPGNLGFLGQVANLETQTRYSAFAKLTLPEIIGKLFLARKILGELTAGRFPGGLLWNLVRVNKWDFPVNDPRDDPRLPGTLTFPVEYGKQGPAVAALRIKAANLALRNNIRQLPPYFVFGPNSNTGASVLLNNSGCSAFPMGLKGLIRIPGFNLDLLKGLFGG